MPRLRFQEACERCLWDPRAQKDVHRPFARNAAACSLFSPLCCRSSSVLLCARNTYNFSRFWHQRRTTTARRAGPAAQKLNCGRSSTTQSAVRGLTSRSTQGARGHPVRESRAPDRELTRGAIAARLRRRRRMCVPFAHSPRHRVSSTSRRTRASMPSGHAPSKVGVSMLQMSA